GAALAGLADEQHFLAVRVLADLIDLVDDGVDRDEANTLRVHFGVLAGLADVDHHRLALIEFFLRFLDRDTGKGLPRILRRHVLKLLWDGVGSRLAQGYHRSRLRFLPCSARLRGMSNPLT